MSLRQELKRRLDILDLRTMHEALENGEASKGARLAQKGGSESVTKATTKRGKEKFKYKGR